MNYLNHLSLSFKNPELLSGNYICDIITPKELKNLNPILMEGILFHRWIDDYSNHHRSLKEINSHFHGYIHKYAPVASDIICDYLLYLSWEKYFELSYHDFTINIYKTLESNLLNMPERVAKICKNMIDHNWLQQYTSIEGIEQVLQRTNRSTRFPVDLTKVLPVLIQEEENFKRLFNEFYQECIEKATDWINLRNAK